MMNSVQRIGLSVFLCVGSVSGVSLGEETPTTLEASRGRVVDVAHIYYNIATGEKVITLMGADQTVGADGGGVSRPIWSSMVGNQCVDHGFTQSYFFAFDDNSGSTSLATGITLNDWGDIAADTVVDCVHIHWVTDHEDVDEDSDGVGDGVEGLGGQWIWWDLDNGRPFDICNRAPLCNFTFSDLPGDTSPPGDGTLAGYSVDVDLAGSFSNSMTFEICDTDSDPQGAAFHYPGIGTRDDDFDGLPDSDIDGDGLADWGWTVRFFQPGTEDFDDDGVLDGDIADSFKPIGVRFGAPDGTAINHGDGTWAWEIETSSLDPGTGEEDAYAFYAPPTLSGDILYAGFYWFGGFKCVDDGAGGYTPSAMFEHQLFGPGNVVWDCDADINGDSVVDFFDVSAFLALFSAGADYNGDGVTDFFDVSSFLSDFQLPCP